MPGTTRSRRERPFAEEVGADAGRLRIGLMAEAPLGIPTDPACVAAARDAAALLEELGHEIVETEVPTVSEELIAALHHDDGRWPRRLRRASTGSGPSRTSATATRTRTTEVSAYDSCSRVQALEKLSRREVARWGRDFDLLLTPTSAILPPLAGSVLEAQHAAPDAPVPEVVASVSFTAFGNVTGQPAISLPLHPGATRACRSARCSPARRSTRPP